jgi:hypothetical protein
MSSGCSGLVKGGLNQGDWRSGEKHRELQSACLWALFWSGFGHFWSVFGHFWSILEVA